MHDALPVTSSFNYGVNSGTKNTKTWNPTKKSGHSTPTRPPPDTHQMHAYLSPIAAFLISDFGCDKE